MLGSMFRRMFAANEARGSASYTSPVGQTIKAKRGSVLLKARILWRNPSGVHGSANHLYAAKFGSVPRGGTPIAPVYLPKGYDGLLPMSRQPFIEKPRPWDTIFKRG